MNEPGVVAFLDADQDFTRGDGQTLAFGQLRGSVETLDEDSGQSLTAAH